VRLVPVGDAWNRARTELPSMALHDADGLHASREGTYLTAAVLVSMLAGRSPERAAPLKSGDPASAEALRALAWRTVFTAVRR
jgi:hypothetical protein